MVWQWCYSSVAMVLQWCDRGVTFFVGHRGEGVVRVDILQTGHLWCYSGVTMVLQCTYSGFTDTEV
jgi:hypothetical protein